jgi:hypothetical protein
MTSRALSGPLCGSTVACVVLENSKTILSTLTGKLWGRGTRRCVASS